MELKEVKEIFDKIARVSAKTSKETIIRQNKDNELFLECLKFLLDSSVVTGLSSKKMNKDVKCEGVNIYDIRVMMNYIKENNSGKDENIKTAQDFCRLQGECEEFCKELLTKKLKVGADAKTVNKALGYNLIPVFGVQLATSYDKCKNKFKGKEIIITEKIDGQKMITIKQNNRVKFYSRQGKELTGLIEIEKDILTIDKDSFMMDGELVSAEEFDNNEDTYKDTMKKASKKGIKTGLVYMVYDYIEDVNKFYEGRDNTKSIDRKINVKKLIEENNLSYVKYLEPWYIGNDLNKIEEFLLKADNEGKEGICANIADAPYETKRTPNLAKCKSFKTADLLVYDIFEGTGEMKNMLGGVRLKGLYNGDMLYTDCGSGFSLEEREYLWSHPEDVLNKIVEVKYFNVSEDSKTKVKSLRFCTWKGLEYIRTDKSLLKDTNIE